MNPAPTPTHYTIKRRKYVRVTELLRARGLIDFSGIPERDRQYYLDRGTAVHEMCEHVERGIDGQHTYDPRVEIYKEAHARFLRDTGFKALPRGIELRVHSDELGVAGRLDRLGTIQGRLCLIDYKTSSVHPATAIQTALYLLCLPKLNFYSVERYGVAFRSNGTYQMSAKYPPSNKTDALWHVHQYHKENKP